LSISEGDISEDSKCGWDRNHHPMTSDAPTLAKAVRIHHRRVRNSAAGNVSVKKPRRSDHATDLVPAERVRARASRDDRYVTRLGSGAAERTTDRWVATR